MNETAMTEKKTPVLEHQELRAFAKEFEAIADRGAALTHELTEAQLHWRPEEKRWSVAECIDHLNITAELYVPALRAAIERGQARGKRGNGPIRHGFLGGFFLKAVSPEGTKKVSAPKKFVPPQKPSVETLLPRFRDAQSQFIDCLGQADGLDLRRIKVPSPALRLLRLPIGTWFAVMIDHQKRHLVQAARVIQANGFPSP